MNSTFKSKCLTVLNERGNYHHNKKNNKLLSLAQNQISFLKGYKPKQLFQLNPNFTDELYNNKKNRLSSQTKIKLNLSLEKYKKQKVNKRSQSILNLHTILTCNNLSSPTLIKDPSNFRQQIEIIQKDFKLREDSPQKYQNNKNKYLLLNSPFYFNKDIFINTHKNTLSEDCFNNLITTIPIYKVVKDFKRKKNFFIHMKTEYGLEKQKKIAIIFKEKNNMKNDNYFERNNIQNVLNNLNYNF